jgi:hypothetical protein
MPILERVIPPMRLNFSLGLERIKRLEATSPPARRCGATNDTRKSVTRSWFRKPTFSCSRTMLPYFPDVMMGALSDPDEATDFGSEQKENTEGNHERATERACRRAGASKNSLNRALHQDFEIEDDWILEQSLLIE